MTITLELPPETEASLLAQAEARGLPLDAFLKILIVNQAESVDTAGNLFHTLQGEELDRAIDDIFDSVQVPAGVGQGAMHRENWYR
jgi:hypothetical protein